MICPIDGIEMKRIPAGVSKKTGKPYNEFHKCEVCGNTQNVPGTKQSIRFDADKEIVGLLREILATLKGKEEKPIDF